MSKFPVPSVLHFVPIPEEQRLDVSDVTDGVGDVEFGIPETTTTTTRMETTSGENDVDMSDHAFRAELLDLQNKLAQLANLNNVAEESGDPGDADDVAAAGTRVMPAGDAFVAANGDSQAVIRRYDMENRDSYEREADAAFSRRASQFPKTRHGRNCTCAGCTEMYML